MVTIHQEIADLMNDIIIQFGDVTVLFQSRYKEAWRQETFLGMMPADQASAEAICPVFTSTTG